MRFISLSVSSLAAVLGALALASCAVSGFGGLGGKSEPPKTVVVADFVVSPEVIAIDRGYSLRHEKPNPNLPILDRNKRTMDRVNDEIIAAAVASLREAGINAQAGNQDAIGLREDVLVVRGRLRASDKVKPAQMNNVGFGNGRSNVAADMTITRVSAGRKEQVFAFTADGTGRKLPSGKAATAFNAAIAAALVAQNSAPEKLSPDVEGPVRRLGASIGDKTAAFAREKGWAEIVQAQPEAKADTASQNAGQVRLPQPKPAQPPAIKPAALAGEPKD